MSVNFKYVPPSPEALSGQSFIEQTEAAFNDLGGRYDRLEENVSQAVTEALSAAQGAEAVAGGALLTAQEAESAAREALAETSSFSGRMTALESSALAALGRAGEAYDLAAVADSKAGGAQNAAAGAQASAESAQSEAGQARQAAGQAQQTADAALLRADSVLSLASPAGQIVCFAAAQAPEGWLECDGSALDRSVYAGLFQVIGTVFGQGDGSSTFNLPDLRGEFIRGWDHGRGVDGGRVFGSAQLDAMQNLTGSLGNIYKGLGGSDGGTSPPQTTGNAFGWSSIAGVYNTSHIAASQADQGFGPVFNASYQARTASENRPRNRALTFCIKY